MVSSHVARGSRDQGSWIPLIYISLKSHEIFKKKTRSPLILPPTPNTQPFPSSTAMYPQSEMDTAFNIQVLTSVDFPDWMAKKPRRRSPKTKKTPGKSSKAPIHTRIWADKFQRTQQPRAHVPAPVKVKPEKQVTSAVEIRKPIQYDSWELIIDGEFLLRGTLRKNLIFIYFYLTFSITYKSFTDYFMRTSPSGSSGSDCCEMGWSEHSDDRGALLEGLRNTSTAAVHQLPAAETNIDYITQLPLQNLTPTPTSHVYAPPDIAPTLFNSKLPSLFVCLSRS